MTTTNTARPSNDEMAVSLQTHLGANLPGLTEHDLETLAAEVTSELQLRVGRALSDGLTDAQLGEFEQLMDSDDDEGCTAWLAANRPNYRAIVLTERTRLIADVVAEVVTADSSAARGDRRFDQTFGVSMDLITHHLETRDISYHTTPDGGLTLTFAENQSRPKVVIAIGHVGQKGTNMFVFTSLAPSLEIPTECQAVMAEFTEDWSQRTWMPKAFLKTDDDTGRCRVVAEIAVPTGREATRDFVDAMMSQCVGSMFGLFGKAQSMLNSIAAEAGQPGDGED